MSRPRRHDDDRVLDATRELLLERGPRATSIRAIAARSGAPSGSLYHRFGSRDGIVAEAWTRAVRRFQVGFLAALEHPEPGSAAADAAAWTFDFATRHPADARLLLAFRREDLLDADLPAELRAELRDLNLPIVEAVRGLARRLGVGRDARDAAPEQVLFAVVDLPYAAVRRHLLGGGLPARLRADLRATARLIVEQGAPDADDQQRPRARPAG